jgi:hypothetical protein
MLLGYEISENDNDEFFLEDEEKLPKEWRYKNTYEYDQLPASLKMKKKKIDIGSTYDGFTIVSERFKSLCEQNKFKGLQFIQLPNNSNFYLFRVDNVLEFDTVARRTEYIKFSKEFNAYVEIIGATPVCLKNKQPVPEGTIYRTDIFFGTGVRKSPVLMTGIKTKELLCSWKLKGIYFNQIQDEYPWQKEPVKEKPKSLLKRIFK